MFSLLLFLLLLSKQEWPEFRFTFSIEKEMNFKKNGGVLKIANDTYLKTLVRIRQSNLHQVSLVEQECITISPKNCYGNLPRKNLITNSRNLSF